MRLCPSFMFHGLEQLHRMFSRPSFGRCIVGAIIGFDGVRHALHVRYAMPPSPECFQRVGVHRGCLGLGVGDRPPLSASCLCLKPPVARRRCEPRVGFRVQRCFICNRAKSGVSGRHSDGPLLPSPSCPHPLSFLALRCACRVFLSATDQSRLVDGSRHHWSRRRAQIWCKP